MVKKRVHSIHLLVLSVTYFYLLNAHQATMELLAQCPREGLKDLYDNLERRKQLLLSERRRNLINEAKTQAKADWEKLSELRRATEQVSQDIVWMQDRLQALNAQSQ